jgi:hypothetical protein
MIIGSGIIMAPPAVREEAFALLQLLADPAKAKANLDALVAAQADLEAARSTELDVREKALDQREADLKAAEAALQARRAQASAEADRVSQALRG